MKTSTQFNKHKSSKANMLKNRKKNYKLQKEETKLTSS